MEVKQIYSFVNEATKEVLGQEALVEEDLSNIVDIGESVFNQNAMDKYVKSLVNHIGKVIFVNRAYRGNVPSVLMDGWEFGSVLQKIQADMPIATENESWELEDGASYDPNVFYKPTVSAKFFNKKVTFEIPMSFTEMQVKQSFSDASQLNAFISMLYNEVEKSMTVKIDELIMKTINNMVGETLHADYGSSARTGSSGVKAVNLLYLYNQQYGLSGADALTYDKALTTPAFVKYASYILGMYKDRLSKISTLFNVGAKARFTSSEYLHCVMLSDFDKATASYLESDTYHNEMVALPNHEVVPFWQGSGTGYAFDDVSQIKVKTTSGDSITQKGVLAVMFDRDALGVANLDRRVTTNYNPKAEFYSNWYKFDAGYFNDLNENFVVFFVA